MSAEQNVDVVGVEYLVHLLTELLNIHLWGEWQSLNEEHRVLKLDEVWNLALFPNNLDWLTEGSWNETAVWHNSDWDWSRGVYEVCDGARLAWVGDLELSNEVSF